jgi:gluconolactonase
MRVLFLCLCVGAVLGQEPEFPLTVDSKVQEGVAKGTLIKDQYVAKEGSVFPGTVREYQLYLPAGFDKTKPAAFMVFQDGVIYQAPVVFDNLIAKGDVPPMVGVFIKPGVVPAANDNALPRFNRSFEYDSVTPLYSRFLIEEFLPAVERGHGITFSTNPNEAAIAGNSSGGICAFMVAWHRPDRFRRVFTGVGTYVGIHGADQLPVWVRKFEPKPIRVFLQSGTGDNNLYCGDWWMANQMMERSLTWAGYEVNHAWGEGGHNQKHASQVFPEAMRWLWREWKTEIEVKANVKGESKWRGYEVVGEGEWERIVFRRDGKIREWEVDVFRLGSDKEGAVFGADELSSDLAHIAPNGEGTKLSRSGRDRTLDFGVDGKGALTGLYVAGDGKRWIGGLNRIGVPQTINAGNANCYSVRNDGTIIVGVEGDREIPAFAPLTEGWAKIRVLQDGVIAPGLDVYARGVRAFEKLCLSPDQTLVYASVNEKNEIYSAQIVQQDIPKDGGDPFSAKTEMVKVLAVQGIEPFGDLVETPGEPLEVGGMCVDTNGWLYVATSLGIQVLDQAGRVNFIIPTPKPASDVCFGGKDLSELFIACGDTVYKRATNAKGVVSGQMAPIKPAPPKL